MSKNSVGAVALDLQVNGRDYQKQISSITSKSTGQMESAFKGTFGRIGKMAVAAFSVAAIGKFVSSCLEAGSALTEVQNIVDVAFPTMNKQIDAFAKNAIGQFGLSEAVAKRYAGTFGSMAQAFKFTEKEAAEMSTTLTGLAGDVASFYDMDADLAYTKLKSVFSGETETLKDLGIVMTQTALDAYALEQGLGKTTKEMSEQEKVMLRYKFVQEQLRFATGDFARTQDSWANQTRVLALRWESFKASIGKGFIALFTPIIKGINWVLSNLQVLADSFASLMEMLTGYSGDSGAGALADTSTDLSAATESSDALSDGLSNAGSSGEAAAKKISKAFGKVDTINKLSFGSDSGSSGSGGGSSNGGSDGGVAEAVDFGKPADNANMFKGILDDIISEFKRLSNIFKVGFSIGFGDSFETIQRLKEHLISIGGSLRDIFTSPEVIGAANLWVESTIYNLGKVVGAIGSVGVTIATLLVGSVSTYLEKNTEFIKTFIVEWFNISRKTNSIIAHFEVIIADIFNIFASSQFIQIGANIIQAIANGAMNATLLASQIGLQVIKGIAIPIMARKDLIKQAISDMFKPLVEVTSEIASSLTNWNSFVQMVSLAASAFAGFKALSTLIPIVASFGVWVGSLGGVFATITGYVSFFFSSLASGSGVIATIQTMLPVSINSLGALGSTLLGLINPVTLVIAAIAALVAGFTYAYASSDIFRKKINSIFSSMAKNVGGIITGLVTIFQTIWAKGLQPVINKVLSGLEQLWNGGLSTFIENTSSFILNLVNGILGIWNNALNPLINLLLNTFLPIFTTVFDAVINVAVPIISNIMEYVGQFMGILDSLLALLNNTVRPVFKTVFNGLSEAVKVFWSFVSPIFNWFTELLGGVVDFAMKSFLAPMKIVMSTLTQLIQGIVDPIGKVFKGIQDRFKGIIDFVTGIFTVNWSKAWDDIKGIFKGAWGSLSGIVSGVWNTILSLFSNGGKIFSGVVGSVGKVFKNIVNSMLSGLNRVIAVPFNGINSVLRNIRNFKVPVVGKVFSWLPSIPTPQIPMLAQGGYVKANQPQLAMIGDNKRYGEIVAPENKLRELAEQAIAGAGKHEDANGMKEIIELLKQLIALIATLHLSTSIDRKGLLVTLKQAEKELAMIGG
ncbi:MAG: hypothetical protein ACK5KR_08925 [Breznakia sp.]